MTETIAPLESRTNVDVRAIERELSALWQQANQDQPDAVTRVCVLNLVTVVHSGRTADHVTDIIALLNTRHPNRAIVVSALPEEGAGAPVLEAWVQAHCRLPAPGRPQVCCEQITIEARGAAVARVPGTVLPLLVPDVPVMLWWPHGEPVGDPRFLKFADVVDRVIVDSATFDAPEAGLARMAALLPAETETQEQEDQPSARGTAISDLSWSRLTPWRELTAQFFDTPALAAHLAEITRITVDYEARPGAAADRSQALLLVGWLAARLGWRTLM